MESATLLALAFGAAAGTILLYAIIRSTMRSTLTPRWIASEPVAYVFALVLTGAISASLAFFGYTLSAIVPSYLAIPASFAVHGGLLAAYMYLVPMEAAKQATRSHGEPINAVS